MPTRAPVGSYIFPIRKFSINTRPTIQKDSRTSGTSWKLVITFESDWQKAKAILSDIATRDAASLSSDAAETIIRQAAQRFAIYYSKLTPIVYLRVMEYGMLADDPLFVLIPRRRRTTEQAIWEDILTEFARHSEIQFAYPTQRFYQYHLEKAGDTAVPADSGHDIAN
jgi:hypothetical protein